MDGKIKNKGQIAVWIILGIALVASVILFFSIEKKIAEPPETVIQEENPDKFIEGCIKEAVEKVVDIILPQGGFVQPKHSFLHNGINVSYLCYNRGNFHPCINEHPLLLSEIENEIKSNIEQQIDECFNRLKENLEDRRAEVLFGEMQLNVSLMPSYISVFIDRELGISKFDQTIRIEKFNYKINSPVYDLTRIAMEIASQEAEFCYFEYVGYMILYPEFKIVKSSFSDSSIVYSIIHKKSGKQMNIAIRGCAIPPGF